MIILRKKYSILIALFYLMGAGLLSAGENLVKDEAPQILTSDLVRKQVIDKLSLVVSFAFVDDDKIETVMINGVSQQFKADDTVVIVKKFIFEPGKTLIKIVAVDEKGNRREKEFLVGYRSVCGDNVVKTNKSENSPWRFNAQFKLTVEHDSNPTADMSSPVKIGDIKFKGVIDDNKQPDIKNSFSALVVASHGKLKFFEGYTRSEYKKKVNFDLKSQALFAGSSYSFPISKSLVVPISLVLMDINVGGKNFSQNIAFETGSLFSSEDSEGFYQNLFGIDLTSIGYADKSKSGGYQSQIKWDYNSLDRDKLDRFRFLMAYGQASSGTKESVNNYLSFDLDWDNQWPNGFKWDLGFGLGKLSYENDLPLSKNTSFGKKRVDIPIRLSNGLGWLFIPNWELWYDFEYFFNLSNKKPYDRITNGLSLKGVF